MQVLSFIKEFDNWLVDFDFNNACKMLSDGTFEFYRAETGEIEIKTFSGLPINLQTYLKRRWPKNEWES